ncbi:MAG TPA: transcriptional repressor [bacterium]|nr:transcriptional repressor [bacterium]
MDAQEKFENFIRKKGLKNTSERKRVIEAVKSLKGHFDTEKLYSAVKRLNKNVSRASVYRTVPLLAAAGVVHESMHKDGRTMYEYSSDYHHHDHMLCIKCGRIIEFEESGIEGLQEKVCRKHRFKMTGHGLVIKGICDKCV